MNLSVTKKNAFGIIEVLLAGVIIITMLGALVVLGKTVLNNLAYSAERSQATFLAQQGIELVRQIRDTNYIDKNSDTKWNFLVSNDGTIFSQPADSTNYAISFKSSRPVLMDPPATDVITTKDSSVFTRTISFQKVTNLKPQGATDSLDENNVFTVKCTVNWGNGKSIYIDEMLTNSHPNF